MKKLLFFLACITITNIAVSQIQRSQPAYDSSQMNAPQKINKREILDELNLTKDQRTQLKAMRQNNKAQKDAIMNNDSLSADQKKMETKQLRKETDQNINAILTDEQREKYKELKKQMRLENNGNKNDSLQNGHADEYTPLNK